MGNCAQKKKDLETRKEYQLVPGSQGRKLELAGTRDERGDSEATQSEGGRLPCPSAGQGNEVYVMTEQREHGESTALEGGWWPLISNNYATFPQVYNFLRRQSTAFKWFIYQIVNLPEGKDCSYYQIPASGTVPIQSKIQYMLLSNSINELGQCPTKIRNHQVRGRILYIISISRFRTQEEQIEKALNLAKRKPDRKIEDGNGNIFKADYTHIHE